MLDGQPSRIGAAPRVRKPHYRPPRPPIDPPRTDLAARCRVDDAENGRESSGALPTYNLGHILVGEGVSGGKTTTVKDGGESDHSRVSTTIRVDYTKNDLRKASLDDVNQGAVLYEDANYEGERTVVGFGNESNDGSWNDSTSSIRLGEDTSLTVREHSENDERFGTPENDPPREIDADVAYVGEKWNDRISWVRREPSA